MNTREKISRAFERNYGINPETRRPYADVNVSEIGKNAEVIGYFNMEAGELEEYFTPADVVKKEKIASIIGGLKNRYIMKSK